MILYLFDFQRKFYKKFRQAAHSELIIWQMLKWAFLYLFAHIFKELSLFFELKCTFFYPLSILKVGLSVLNTLKLFLMIVF
jgi:hypothetical protein